MRDTAEVNKSKNAFSLQLRSLVTTQMGAHLNRTNRGHRLPSSPSLRPRSRGASLPHGEVGHLMQLWEADTDVRISAGTEKFRLSLEKYSDGLLDRFKVYVM